MVSHSSSLSAWRHVCVWAVALGAGAWLTAAAVATVPPPSEWESGGLSAADQELLDQMERTAFRFFAEQAHPQTGLVRDRARADGSASDGKASISVSGFAFDAWVIAAERGWVERAAAVERVRHTLQFLADHVTRRHGFYYHFLEMDTGARAWQCELSSVDTSLLLAGAIVAREYFQDPAITQVVNRLLGELDWAWFRNDGRQVALSWHDETGFSRYRWNKYSEHVLMSFMALGTSPRPVEADYWQEWDRKPIGRYGDYVYLQEPPLFVHQFPQAYIDLRDRRDAFADYFRNSRLATLAQRQFCIDLRPEFPSWGENLWGLTASDSTAGYKIWGGPPRTLRTNLLDGTIVPCATAGSLVFTPRESLAVLHQLKLAYGDRIWGRYGFVDAFNPETGWVNSDVLGIDQGITMLQAENLRTGLIQRLFMQSPEAQLALKQAGLLSTRRDLTLAQRQQVREGALLAWHNLQSTPAEAGLQLTALLAAHELGLVNGNECVARAQSVLAAAPPPRDAEDAAQFAAGLVAVRQALPSLQAEASQLLASIPWDTLLPAAAQLGTVSRLAVFFQVAAGVRPADSWLAMRRNAQTVGLVQVLVPASPAGLLLPGLWLDERAIVTGAAAAQLAYGRLSGAGPADQLPEPMHLALLLDCFPVETMQRLGAKFATDAMARATPAGQAALLITAANVLGADCVRRWFQRDPLVRAGRAAIPEFAEAAFGPNTSVIAQRELSPPRDQRPVRQTVAVATTRPRAQWDWQKVAGLEYKNSDADVFPGDAPLEYRFAFTWDATALHFHAEVKDTPAGYPVPPVRNRMVFLFVDPDSDGLVWTGPRDYQFCYKVGDVAQEFFNHAATQAEIRTTEEGYTVEASIPWKALGLAAQPGLEFSLSPSTINEGVRESEPSLQLIWSSQEDANGHSRLGRLRLQ